MPGRLEIGDGPVRQVAPVGDLARDVVGNPADGEVGVGVGDDHGDLGVGVELTGSQRGADAGVASSDGDEVHEVSCRDRLVTRRVARVGPGAKDAPRRHRHWPIRGDRPERRWRPQASEALRRWWGKMMSDASAGVTPG